MITASLSGRLVLAHHYLWYGTPWGGTGRWSHWDQAGCRPDHVARGRRDAAVAYAPLDGLYDSRDRSVLRRQIAELQEAGVDASIVSFWGFGHPESGDLELLLAESERASHRVTIYYESLGLVPWEGATSLERSWMPTDHLRRLLAGYARSPAWLRIKGRPVIGIYVANKDPAIWRHARAALEAEGHQPLLLGDGGEDFVGDEGDGVPEWMAPFDVVHSYIPLTFLEGGGDLDAAYRRMAARAHAGGKLFAATALPGFDYRSLQSPPRLVPRCDGATIRTTWRAGVNAPADWMLITSYNEWGDGTQIEPSQEYGRDYLDMVAGLARNFRYG